MSSISSQNNEESGIVILSSDFGNFNDYARCVINRLLATGMYHVVKQHSYYLLMQADPTLTVEKAKLLINREVAVVTAPVEPPETATHTEHVMFGNKMKIYDNYVNNMKTLGKSLGLVKATLLPVHNSIADSTRDTGELIDKLFEHYSSNLSNTIDIKREQLENIYKNFNGKTPLSKIFNVFEEKLNELKALEVKIEDDEVMTKVRRVLQRIKNLKPQFQQFCNSSYILEQQKTKIT
jgi:ribosomal protein L7Ae-like RNA K-turn-binding protein